jgi:hypothetical protein
MQAKNNQFDRDVAKTMMKISLVLIIKFQSTIMLSWGSEGLNDFLNFLLPVSGRLSCRREPDSQC